MSDASDIQARLARFQRFINVHAEAFARVAADGFREKGAGVVVLRVATLEGGDEFRPEQAGTVLEYWSKAALKKLDPRDHDTEAALSRCGAGEAVVVAVYPDGGSEGVRVNIARLAECMRRADGPADPSLN